MRVMAQDAGDEMEHDGHAVMSLQADELERVFTDYLDPIYRFFYRRVGNREDAEDLASQVFLKATRQLDNARNEASVASWLFTVARTVLADHWRRYYSAPPPLALNDEIASAHPYREPDRGSSKDTEQQLEMVLQELSPRYRRVLELRFLLGYSIEEAAQDMGVTAGNLRVLQHRALSRAAAIGLPRMVADDAGIAPGFEVERTVTSHHQEPRALGGRRRATERNA